MRISKNSIAIQSQNWIFSSFINLLTSMSYEDITVTMICQEANIDRRTFYRYFENKTDVLHSYLNLIFDEYMKQVMQMQSQNSIDYLRLFFVFFSQQYGDFLYAMHHNGILASVFLNNEKYLTEVNRLLNTKLMRNSGNYETAFRAGGLINILSAWIGNNCEESVDDMIMTVTRVLK